MREKTYLTKLNANLDKFIEACQKGKGGVRFYCNYNDGVLFGNGYGFDFIKSRSLNIPDTRENGAFKTIYESFKEKLESGGLDKVETITEGSTKELKKALRLTSADYNVYVNPKLLGVYPDGTEFYTEGRKNPITVVYNGEIIKIVCPFIIYDVEFKEAE